jgi:hypothetical protein
LDALNPSWYDKGSDMVDNIDEFIHVPFMMWKDIFECCLYNNHMMLLIILMCSNKMMILLQKFSKHPRMTQCNVLLVISGHTLRNLMNIPLSTWIYSMKKIINRRCAQILIEVRMLLA